MAYKPSYRMIYNRVESLRMKPDRIKMSTLLAATAAIVLLECVSESAVSATVASAMVATGLTRTIGIGVLLLITLKMQGLALKLAVG